MKMLSKKRPTSTAIIFAIASLLLPIFASANIQITEIMYDVPGSDTGREWVEVTNTSSEILDVGKYKLFENDTNHGLKLIAGSSVLPPGVSAILASDANKFISDHPNFSGALFDTAFSLSNTGESLALKDASSTLVHTVLYVAAAETSGTGGSLHVIDGGLTAALADPGVFPGALTPILKAKSNAASSSKIQSTKKKEVRETTPLPVTKNSSQDSHAAAVSLTSIISPQLLYLLGLLSVILLGVAGVLFLLGRKQETSHEADEFKIE